MPRPSAVLPTPTSAVDPRFIEHRLLADVESFFTTTAPVAAGDHLLVAFSGGADSTALLALLLELAPRHDWRITAAHLDHGLDPDSERRARDAGDLARRLGASLIQHRSPVELLRRAGESREAAARRVRYDFLAATRRALDACWIATAHHLDDQAETVLLRCLQGSGWQGLAGIRPVHGEVARPLLAHRHRDLEAWLAWRGLHWVEDPTNRDDSVPRNRVRHALLPSLEATARQRGRPPLAPTLAHLATVTRRVRISVDRRLAENLGFLDDATDDEPAVSVSREALSGLPPPLLAPALALLHRRVGAPHPPGGGARRELLRQLTDAATVTDDSLGIDCGDGWRWRSAGDRLVLERRRDPPRVPRFTYTLEAPGEVIVEETGIGVRLSRQPVAPWMFRGSATRAGLNLPLAPGERVVVRNRRPGDRLRPLGSPGRRRLKDVLIDRQVPRDARDRLPLLVVDDRLAWVPGVTVDHAFRLPRRGTVWVVELFQTAPGINTTREPFQ